MNNVSLLAKILPDWRSLEDEDIEIRLVSALALSCDYSELEEVVWLFGFCFGFFDVC